MACEARVGCRNAAAGGDMGENVSVVDRVVESGVVPPELFEHIEHILDANDDREVTAATAAAMFALSPEASVTFAVRSLEDGSFTVYDHYLDGNYTERHVGDTTPAHSLSNVVARANRPAERHVAPGTNDPWFLDYPDFFGIPVLHDEVGNVVRTLIVGLPEGADVAEDTYLYCLSVVAGFCERAYARIGRVRGAVETGRALEREYVLQEIHDTAVQDIFACELGLVAAISSAEAGGTVDAADLRTCLEHAQAAGHSIREVLSDAPLAHDGFALVSEILEKEVDLHEQAGGPTTARILDGDMELGGTLARTVRMVVHECLCNVRKHANATQAIVFSSIEDGVLSLCVEDDGAGFDVNGASGTASGDRAASRPPDMLHFGLRNLKKALAAIGGKLAVESAPGEGCAVHAKIRLEGTL